MEVAIAVFPRPGVPCSQQTLPASGELVQATISSSIWVRVPSKHFRSSSYLAFSAGCNCLSICLVSTRGELETFSFQNDFCLPALLTSLNVSTLSARSKLSFRFMNDAVKSLIFFCFSGDTIAFAVRAGESWSVKYKPKFGNV